MISTQKLAEHSFENYDNFLLSILPNKIKLELDFDIQVLNDPPGFTILFNQDVVYYSKLVEGSHNLIFELNPLSTNVLELSMNGKTVDNLLINDGKIIRDTFIEIKKILINDYDLLEDFSFFYNKFEYYDNETKIKEDTKTGFWQNKTLHLTFDHPFERWYNKHSDKNATLDNTDLEFSSLNYSEQLSEQLVDLAKTLKK